jgi:hypothetical protein
MGLIAREHRRDRRLAMGDWVVEHDGDPWWSLPYVVRTPYGFFITYCWTLWGAKRVIRREKAKRASAPRVVYRESDDDAAK